jgi:hypothetical protein
MTAPDFSSGVNNHSEPTAKPRPASNALPSADPNSAIALFVEDGLMREQVGGSLWHTPCLEKGGRADHAPLALSDFAGDRRRISEPAYEERNVYAGCNKVDVTVVENDIDIERWMFGEEGRKSRHDVQAGESERAVDPQAAGQSGSRPSGREFRFVGFLDGSPGAFVKAVPGFRRRQAVCRTH